MVDPRGKRRLPIPDNPAYSRVIFGLGVLEDKGNGSYELPKLKAQELADKIGINQSVAIRYLNFLKKEGWVNIEKVKKSKFYSLNLNQLSKALNERVMYRIRASSTNSLYSNPKFFTYSYEYVEKIKEPLEFVKEEFPKINIIKKIAVIPISNFAQLLIHSKESITLNQVFDKMLDFYGLNPRKLKSLVKRYSLFSKDKKIKKREEWILEGFLILCKGLSLDIQMRDMFYDPIIFGEKKVTIIPKINFELD